MSDISLEHLQILIAEAVTDAAFRDALLSTPGNSAKNSMRTALVPEDIEMLESIKDDLQRFGANSDLHPTDATLWTVGAIILGVARTRNKKWAVNVTSIARRQVPPKNWKVAVTSIPRRRVPPKNWKVAVTSIPRRRVRPKNWKVAVTSIPRLRARKKNDGAGSPKPGSTKRGRST